MSRQRHATQENHTFRIPG